MHGDASAGCDAPGRRRRLLLVLVEGIVGCHGLRRAAVRLAIIVNGLEIVVTLEWWFGNGYPSIVLTCVEVLCLLRAEGTDLASELPQLPSFGETTSTAALEEMKGHIAKAGSSQGPETRDVGSPLL